MKDKFVGLIILDGFGLREESHGNAIRLANPENFNKYFSEYPHTTLEASGRAVGLPEGQMGNSEVGHLNIGAGRVVYQSFEKINNAIADKSFYDNESINKVFAHAIKHNGAVHVMGLLSDGGVHSHINHLFALLNSANKHGVKKLFVHAFTDGRDVFRDSAPKYLKALQEKLDKFGYKLGTVCGRAYAMDREQNYDRIKLQYDAMCYDLGEHTHDIYASIDADYKKEIYDEFHKPFILDGFEPVSSGDGLIFFNFREDRGRELTKALVEDNFDAFERKDLKDILMCTFTEYDKSYVRPLIAWPKEDVTTNLSAIISNAGLKQFKCTETTKYAHVTYFLNGGIEKAYPGEDRYLIDTIKVLSFDQTPAMRAVEITDKAIERIKTQEYSFMALNYSNTDMIGHTGNLNAAIETVKVVDKQLGRLVDAILSIGGTALIIADHGNAEYMIDDSGRVLTDHTTNPVPCIIVSEPKKDIQLSADGKLGNVAPTILQLLGIKAPKEFELPSLIK